MEKKKILVVDDSEVLCNSLKAMIEENGDFEVRCEMKGSLTITAAKTFKPDLILLDILMPDVDGVTVAIELNKDVFTKEIPVIFLTAVAQSNDVQDQGNIFGGYYVLPKSVSTDELIKCIGLNLK